MIHDKKTGEYLSTTSMPR